MKICHIVEAAGAGTGQIVLDLARAQSQDGHQVYVIYGTSRAEALFVQELNAIPHLTVFALPMRRQVGLHDVMDGFSLWKLVRKLGPFDIIHAHSSKAGALTRLAGVFWPRAKILYTPHGFVTLDKGACWIYRVIEWFLSFFCDAIITTSDYEYQHARKFLHLPARKLYTIWNGTNVLYKAERHQARAKLGYSEDVFLVGFVGRIVEGKNLPRLLESFAIAQVEKPDLHLVILGDGHLKEQIIALIAQKGWDKTGHVRVFSGLPARDYYPAFDVLVNSSDFESFGLVIIEALVAGVPVVTTPMGIAQETVITGQTGFLGTFDPRDLARGILSLASLDEGQRAQMAHACKAQALRFKSEDVGLKTMALYQELLQKR
ncbi:MAG: glycosyltransferase [Alphaproteobacteria bacterium]|nr:glycosyltransferase [Alphaproteobacteria bacterium]